MERQLEEFGIEELLSFGKYSNYTIKEVYQFAPSYLECALINVDYFYIDLEDIKDFQTPTPMRLWSFTFKGEEHWVSNLGPDTDYIAEAYKYLEQGKVIPEEHFQFSQAAIQSAKDKKNMLDTYGTRTNSSSRFNDDYSEDDYNEYGSSYEKYGGYNGYSDDVIDDAFEGDPSNTWNVD